MAEHEVVERALDACYDALVAPETWSHALDTLARSVDAAGCVFYPRDQVHKVPTLPISPGSQELVDVYMRDSWYLRDPHVQRGWPLAEAGRKVVTEHDISDAEERRISAFYQEFIRPTGLAWWAAVCFAPQRHFWCLTLHRATENGPFPPSQVKELASLSSHLRRIVTVAEKLAAAQIDSGMRTLENLRCAALLIDAQGRVVRISAQAEPLFGVDLGLSGGRLWAKDAASNMRLQSLLALITPAASPGATAAPDPVIVNRNGKPWLSVEIMPVGGLASDVFGTARAMVLMTDVTQSPVPREALLRSTFGLTATEARLAIHIGAGESLLETTDALKVKKETARTLLKGVFAKTDTHRQAQLVALLARLASRH